MKTIWNVEARSMNGSITVGIFTSSFIDKELADKAAEKVKELNKNSKFEVSVRVYKSDLYENENEVPILNTK